MSRVDCGLEVGRAAVHAGEEQMVVRLEYLVLSTAVLRHSSLFNVAIFFLYGEP